jgi:hypothetical protein
LTPENLESPWILFEAGALSKQQKSSHVCTFLFDIEPVNIREPLAQFQATKAQKDDIEKLIQTINRACGDTGLNEGKLRDTFDVWWPHLEKSLESIPLPSKEHTERRDTTEVLEEILELVRSLSRVDRLSVQRLPVRPRLVTMVKWPPEDAQIVMEHYQEVLKEYGPACADETIQRHLSLLKTDTEYTLKALNYLKTPRKMAELFDVYPWITRLLSDYDDDQIPF